MTMADRIVVLRGGVVEQIGMPLELYDNPAKMFVGAFLGSPSMNFLKGHLSDDGTPSLRLADNSQILLHGCPDGHAGSQVVLGVRPQDIVEDQDNGTPAVIQVIEPTGADTHLLAEIAGETVTCVLPAVWTRASAMRSDCRSRRRTSIFSTRRVKRKSDRPPSASTTPSLKLVRLSGFGDPLHFGDERAFLFKADAGAVGQVDTASIDRNLISKAAKGFEDFGIGFIAAQFQTGRDIQR